MNKRAQGLSMKTIVVAIIALLVLVVIIVIFSGQIGEVSKGFTQARDSAKLCREDFLGREQCLNLEECPNGWILSDSICQDKGYICCEEP